MDGALTYTSGFCRMLTDYLATRAVELGPVLAAMGATADQLLDVDARISRRGFLAAFEVAVELTGDPDLGLHVGEHVRPANFGVLGYLMMSCESLRQAADRHRRWHELIADGERVEYVRVGDRSLHVEHFPPGEPAPPACAVACAAASTVTFVRWLTGPDDGLLAVELPFPAPARRDAYDRLFRCELIFDAPRLAYWRNAEIVRRPLPQSDPELRRQMELRVVRLAASRVPVDRLVGQVRALVARTMAEQPPDLDGAAAQLGMTARALVRALADQGTTYTRIVDDTRRQLAIGYIEDPALSLLDVAYLVGFSEQSAFHRAFKRWTGLTPGEYRRRSP